MDFSVASTDALEQEIVGLEETRSQLAAEQMKILEELDSRQVAAGDGSRSLSEWVAARLDVSVETARSLVRTMRRTAQRSDLRVGLAEGNVSFDRVEAVSRIRADVGLMECLDVAGVRREAAKRVRISADAESRSVEDSYLVIQPNLDESWWRLWGGLDGYTGAIVDKALTDRADSLPELPDGSRGSVSWRKAMALGEICVSDDAPSAQVTVFVDAREAAVSNGEAGVVVEAGPRVGRQVLEAVLCDASTEVIARTGSGEYLNYGRRQRTATPTQKRALHDRYAGRCAADGCDSRHRLQAHHITPWSQGGATDLDDLVLLCWFHHHVIVHRQGFTIYKHPVTGRIRFRKPRFSPESETSM